jgi:outer membrane protein OmpA-like peptidoglycan-associated protein
MHYLKNKIKFELGSDSVDPMRQDLLDLIAKLLQTCQEMALEISGHTDSQGREEMNQSLSKSRATAVLVRNPKTSGVYIKFCCQRVWREPTNR